MYVIIISKPNYGREFTNDVRQSVTGSFLTRLAAEKHLIKKGFGKNKNPCLHTGEPLWFLGKRGEEDCYGEGCADLMAEIVDLEPPV